MEISKTKECEALCKRQNTDGCCYLGNFSGCYWKPNADSIEIYHGSFFATSVKCVRGKLYFIRTLLPSTRQYNLEKSYHHTMLVYFLLYTLAAITTTTQTIFSTSTSTPAGDNLFKDMF